MLEHRVGNGCRSCCFAEAKKARQLISNLKKLRQFRSGAQSTTSMVDQACNICMRFNTTGHFRVNVVMNNDAQERCGGIEKSFKDIDMVSSNPPPLEIIIQEALPTDTMSPQKGSMVFRMRDCPIDGTYAESKDSFHSESQTQDSMATEVLVTIPRQSLQEQTLSSVGGEHADFVATARALESTSMNSTQSDSDSPRYVPTASAPTDATQTLCTSIFSKPNTLICNESKASSSSSVQALSISASQGPFEQDGALSVSSKDLASQNTSYVATARDNFSFSPSEPSQKVPCPPSALQPTFTPLPVPTEIKLSFAQSYWGSYTCPKSQKVLPAPPLSSAHQQEHQATSMNIPSGFRGPTAIQQSTRPIPPTLTSLPPSSSALKEFSPSYLAPSPRTISNQHRYDGPPPTAYLPHDSVNPRPVIRHRSDWTPKHAQTFPYSAPAGPYVLNYPILRRAVDIQREKRTFLVRDQPPPHDLLAKQPFQGGLSAMNNTPLTDTAYRYHFDLALPKNGSSAVRSPFILKSHRPLHDYHTPLSPLQQDPCAAARAYYAAADAQCQSVIVSENFDDECSSLTSIYRRKEPGLLELLGRKVDGVFPDWRSRKQSFERRNRLRRRRKNRCGC